MQYLANSFSLQMLKNFNSTIKVEEINELPKNLISAIGHKNTADILGVELNRINISLDKGDVLYVAQLIGGRLPEGSTELPIGYSFKFLKVEIF